MKKKYQIEKLLDLIIQEHKEHPDGLGFIDEMCNTHLEDGNDWCPKNCQYPMDYKKCIRKWYLGEDI